MNKITTEEWVERFGRAGFGEDVIGNIRELITAAKEEGRNEAVDYISNECPLIEATTHERHLFVRLAELPEGTYFKILPNTVLEAARRSAV